VIKVSKFSTRILFSVAIGLLGILPCEAEEFSIEVHVNPAKGRVQIVGKSQKPISTGTIIFEDSYADVTGISQRISNFQLRGEKGEEFSPAKTGAGIFDAKKTFNEFTYDVSIEPLASLTSAAHVSWLTEKRGLLMLNDLLPTFSSLAKQRLIVRISIPGGWNVETSEKELAGNQFIVEDPQRAIFFVRNHSQAEVLHRKFNESDLQMAIDGDWLFSNEEALEFATSIFAEYLKIFSRIPAKKILIVVAPFPQKADADRWRAETRGSTIVVLSGSMPFKTLALQRLHEQLRHEIFHLWIPNSLALKGDYSWFFEGFSIYRALRAGVDLNQIRFEDFLSTLERAARISKISRAGTSLVQDSNFRWQMNSARTEARGVFLAFLCDIALLRESNGKRSLDSVFRTLFVRHGIGNEIQDANESIVKILKESKALSEIVSLSIESEGNLRAEKYLAMAGMTLADGFDMKLLINPKLKGREKALLRKLGYDNWKKVAMKKE